MMMWWQQPWFSILIGVCIFAALEALKRWPAFQDRVLAGPWSDLVAVVLLVVASSAPRLLAGEPLDAVAQAAGTALASALGSWALGEAGARAREAKRDDAELGP